MNRRRLMEEGSKLSLSFETYNTNAASGNVNISMQYDGKTLSSGESGISYVTTNGMTCSRSGTGYKLSWNANYDERNEKVYTITITYKGESKSADIIQGKDYVLETNEVISVRRLNLVFRSYGYSGDKSNFPDLSFYSQPESEGGLDYYLTDEKKYKSGRTEYVHNSSGGDNITFIRGNICPSKSGDTVSVTGNLTATLSSNNKLAPLTVKTSQDNSAYTSNNTFNFDIYNIENNKIGSGSVYYNFGGSGSIIEIHS